MTWISSSDRSLTNSWWKTGTNLRFFEDYDNIALNPGFEEGDVSWVDERTLWNISSTANAYEGNYCATYPGSGSAALRNARYVNCKEGQKIYAEGYVRADIGTDGTAGVRISWLDSSLNEIFITDFTDQPITTYTLQYGVATAPSGTVYARPEFVAYDVTTGLWYADHIYAHKYPAYYDVRIVGMQEPFQSFIKPYFQTYYEGEVILETI
jgi:hypothetical protein